MKKGVLEEKVKHPLWMWPNLISIDAPIVAVVWMYAFAKTWGVSWHPLTAYCSLFIGVWLVYVVDRLIDASIRKNIVDEPRHRFHRKHQQVLKYALVFFGLIGGYLMSNTLPTSIFPYLFVCGFLQLIFFGLSLLQSSDKRQIPYGKNIVAGVTFALGTALGAHIYTGFSMLGWLFSREVIVFGLLCVLNISAIDIWELSKKSSDEEENSAFEMSLSMPLIALGAAALLFATLEKHANDRPFYYSVLASAGLIFILNRVRDRFSMNALRVLIDVAMLTPLWVFVSFSKA